MANKKFIIAVSSSGLIIFFILIIWANVLLKGSAEFLKTATSTLVEDLYEEGEYFYSNGKYDKSLKIFHTLIRKYPDNKELVNKINKKIEELNIKLLFSDIITEDSFLYEVKKGDTLAKIAARFNTTVQLIVRANKINSPDLIIPGQLLKIIKARFSILVDKSRNTLTLFKNGKPIKVYTVSTGENNSTPTGRFVIEEKLIKPVWYKIGAIVPPDSPEYELGSRWIGISKKGYGIHGTDNPETIGRYITRGCIRMYNRDVEELFDIVPGGTEVLIVE